MHTRQTRNPVPSALILIAWCALAGAGLVAPFAARANPTGGSVVAGAAGIAAPNASTVVVTQSSNRAIINWSDFSIGVGEVTKFIQPSASAAILNRVLGSDPSALLGDLQANGQIYLINPNGIVVGRGSRIDVGGFTASTLGVSNAEFLAGQDLHLSGQSGAAVANLGAIDASQGNVYLVAQQVTNAGSISAAKGTAGLAAGTEVTLTANGTEHVLIGGADTAAGPGGAAVLNSGTIQAARAELKAEDGNLYALAINNSGVVRATGVRSEGGHIYLTADGAVDVSGTLDASGKAAGGQVIVSGSNVKLDAGSLVTASGGTTGGTVLIGGDRAGGSNPALDLSATPVADADYTTVAAGAKISADGGSGNGGSIIVWSSDATDFEGSISARGGIGATGGFAEVSSHQLLNFTGTADLTAPGGTLGTLLLDPENVTISSGSTTGGTFTGTTYNPTVASSILNVTDLENALDLANVNVTTGSTGSQTGTITVSAALTWTPPGGGSTLTLTAAGAVAFNAAVTVPANGGLTVSAGGAITQSAPITQSASALPVVFNAGANTITLTNASNAFHGVVELDNSGAKAVALTNSVPTELGTSSVGTSTLTVTSTGSITQNGAITVASGGGATFNAGAGSITLTNASNDFPLTVDLDNSGANNVSLTNSVATKLGTSSVGTGTVTISSGGAITQGGAFTQASGAGAVSISAGANAITLTQSNDFTGAVSLTNSGANAVNFDNAGASATILGTLSLGSGSLVVTAAGPITQTGPITQASGAGAVSFSAGANSITLTQSNAFYGTLAFTDSGTGGVSVTNSQPTAFATVSVGTGGLTVNSSGAITQSSGTITDTGAASFTAGNNIAITLTKTNAFAGAVSVNNTGTGAVSVTNGAALVMGASSVGSTLTLVASGSISETGAITTGGALSVGVSTASSDILLGSYANNFGTAAPTFGGTKADVLDFSLENTNSGATLPSFTGVTNLRNLTLDFPNAAIALPSLTLATGGNLSVTAGGAITQSGIATVPGTSAFTTGTFAITLTQSNDFVGAVSLSNSGSNAVSLTNNNALVLGTSSVGGNLNLVAAGTISETGPIVANAGTTTIALTVASSDILLGSQANDFGTDALAFNGTKAEIRDVSLENINSGAAVPSFTGVTNLRNLTLDFPNAAISLPAVTLTGSLSLTSGGTVTLPGLTLASGQTLSVAAGGAITQTAADTVPGTSSFTTGAFPITLTQSGNSFTGAVTLSNTGSFNVSLTDSIALALGTSTVGGNLAVTAGGAITQAGALSVSGTSSFSSGANPITLTQSGNSFTGAVSLSNTGSNNASLTAGGALALGTSTIGGNLTATASGNLGVGAITAANVSLSTSGAGDSITFAGAVTASNSITANAATGGIVLNSGALLTANGSGSALVLEAGSSSAAGTVVGGDFVNNVGSGALSTPTAGANWLIYTGDLSGSGTVLGGLGVPAWRYDSATSYIPATGTDEVLYRAAPTLTITATAQSSTYGTTPSLTGTDFTVAGEVSGNGSSTDTQTAALGGSPALATTATATSSVLGGPYPITPSSGSITNPHNYQLSFANGSLSINPAALTVTANSTSKSYGQTVTFAGTEFTSTGLQNGETIGSATISSSGAASTANASATPYAINISAATGGTFTSSNYTITYDSGLLTVNPAALTVTANGTSKTYGQTVTFAGTEFTSTGLQNGQTIGSATISSAGAASTANASATPYTINISGATGGTFNSSNYTITYDSGSLTVNPAALTVTANSTSKTYGQTVTFAGTEFTSTGLQNGQTIGTVTLTSTGAAATAGVGSSPYAINASAATGGTFSASNYTITYDPGVLTVDPAALTITANSTSKTYGQTVTFAGTEFSSAGLQNGETIGSVTLSSAGAASTANASATPYTITASGATGGTFSAGNYTITYDSGSLTVNPAALTITANSTSKTYGQTVTFAGTEFTSTGLQNGETIGSVTLTSTGAAATAGVGSSPYAINASAATGGTFSASNYTITYDSGVLTVDPAALTVTANSTSKSYGQTVTFAGTEFSTTGLQNGETIGAATISSAGAASTANASATPYTINISGATGGTFNSSNYTITYDSGSLTVNPAALTVTANSTSKTYGQTVTFAGTEFTSTGLQNGETIGSVTLTSTGAAATAGVGSSPYAINASAATGGTFSASNYTITYDPGMLTINPAALTITADSTSKTYGQTVTFAGTEFSSTGLQNGETIGSVTLASVGASSTANASATPYIITASNATGGTFDAGNYTITYDSGSLTVNPAALTITANSTSKTYGQTITFAGTEFGSTGLQNGETIGSVMLTSTGAASTASASATPYAINISGATGGTFSASNYTITYDSGLLTVNPAALTVTASSTSKTYGQTITFAGTEFTSTGLQNGETIGTVTLTSTGAAATAGVGSSPYAINASAATGGTFSASNYTITYDPGMLTVDPAALTITANSTSKTYGQSITFAGTEFSSSGLQNGETIGTATISSAGAVDTANASATPYAINISGATGGTFNLSNYTITYDSGSLTVNPAALTITASSTSKTYGQTVTFAGTEFTSTGLQNGETIGTVTLTSTGAAATAGVGSSPYAIDASAATGGTFSASNYTITYNPGVLTVDPAALTITANSTSKTYGQSITFAGTEFSSSGLQNGETIGTVTLSSAGAAGTASVSGSPYTITASNAAGGTFDAGNYTITYDSGSLTVNPAALTVTANSTTKVYGNTLTFAGTEFTSTGLQNGETIGTVSLASAGAVSTANVAGSPYAITASNATGGTFNPGNYTITYVPGLLTVSPAALTLTITADNESKTYGQTFTFTGTEFMSTGLVGGDTIGSVTLTSTGAPSTAVVGNYPIVISNATGGTFNPSNYSITYDNGVLTVNPAALTITANSTSKTYGQTVTFAGTEFSSTGLQNGETIGSVTLTSSGAAATAGVGSSPYAINASAATGGTFSASNYTITYDPGMLTVNPAALAITADSTSKTYGQTVSFAGTEFTSTGLQNGETIGTVTLSSAGAASTANASATPYTITASGATGGTFSASNYTITYDSGSLTVNPAALTITANSTSKAYGQTITFSGTEFTSTGLQNGETIGSVTLTSTGAAATAGVGSSPYAINASAATGGTFSASNYTITYDPGMLTVNPAALTITADSTSKTYGQTLTFAGTEFSSTGLQNGETIGTVALTSAGAAGTANVSGSPYTITASNATGGTFDAGNYTITYDSGSLTVNPAALTVTANSTTKVYGNTLTFAGTEFTSTGLQNGETIGTVSLASAGAASTANVAGSPYTITASNATGGTFNPGNYTITYVPGLLTVSPAALTLTITADNESKTYGQTFTFAGTEFTSTGLVGGDTIGSVTLTSTGAPSTAVVGNYPIIISGATGGTFNPTNYSITYDNGVLTVNPAALTITANSTSKTYGQTVTFAGTEFTSAGLQNGETIGSVTLSSAGAANTANVAGSPYAINASAATGGTFSASNYTITYDSGMLTVNPAALTVTADSTSKTYGQTVSFAGTEFASTGLQNGETIGAVTLSSAGAASTANVAGSPYAITASNATGGTFSPANYAITYDPGMLTVNPAALTVTANSTSKAYGQAVTFAGTEFTSAGLQNGETIGTVTLSSAGAASTANASATPYTINISNAAGGTFDSGNYTITYDSGSLTVNPAALTVTANSTTKVFGNTLTFAGTEFTSTGLQNGETIGSVALASAGAVSTANVAGSPYAITVSNATGGTFNPANYTITYVPGLLTVSPAALALSITADDESKSYGQTFTFAGTEFTSTGLVGSDTIGSVTLTSTGAPSTAGVGTYPIVISNAAGGTFNPSNYTITYNNGVLTVNPAALTVTANSTTKVFGNTLTFAGTEFTAAGLQNGETVGSVTLASAGAVSTANVAGSPYAITVSNATGGTFNPANYTITYVPGLLTVSPAALALSITADDESKTYGQTFTFAGTEFTSTGLVGGDTIGSVTLTCTGAPSTAGVGTYPIIISGATGGTFNPSNYTITYNNGVLTVNPAALTVTANSTSKTYGQTVTFAGTEFTSTGLENGETIGSVTLASPGAASTANVAGSPYTITAGSATGGTFNPANYTITYDPGLLTVDPAALTVTANSTTKVFGNTLTFAGTEFTAAGLQNGETVGSVTLASAGAVSTANVAGSPYTITASNATGGTFNPSNYSITYVPGLLTVSPAALALSITADDESKTYGQTFTFAGTEFTSVGLAGGDTIGSVTLTSTGAPSTAGVGSYPIVISNATGGTFNPSNYTITYNNGVLTVNPAALTVTANSTTKVFGNTLTFAGTEFTSMGLQNGETIGTVSLASAGAVSTANVAGSPYTITASNATGGTFNPSNYSITYVPGLLTVSPAALALSITADDESKTYGQTFTFAGTEFTSVGLAGGDTIGSVTLTSTGAPSTAGVGTYPIVIGNATGGTFNPSNYTITYNNGVLTVNPAALTITANSTSKTFGQTVSFAGTEFTAAGLQNGETVGSVSLASAGAVSTANVAGSPYPITASNATGGTFNPANYAISYVPGLLTVNPAALTLTITADDESKTYGQTFTFAGTEFTSVGLAGGDTIGSVTLTSAGAPSSAGVGAYPIIISNATGGTFNPANYAITYDNGVLTVNPAALTITAESISKTYGQTVTFAGTEFTATGLQNGETIGSVSLASAGAAGTANVAGSPYAITAGNAAGGTFNAGNYAITYDAGSLTIDPATLTAGLTGAATKTYDGTTSATLSGGNYTLTGIINGDSVSLNDPANGAYASKDVGAGIDVTASGLLLGGPQAGNYVLASASVTGAIGAITPATLTYVANPVSVSLGAAFPVFGGTVSGFVGGDSLANATTGTLAFATTAGPTSPAGSYAIDGSGLTAADYTFVQASSNATALTVNNPGNVGTQPIDVGTTPPPVTNPPAGSQFSGAGGNSNVGGGSSQSDSAAGAPLTTTVITLSVGGGGSGGNTVDINNSLPPGSGQVETSIGMGNFLVVYQTNFANGHEDNGGFQGSLDYASSYTTFDSNDGPTSRVRHPSG